jgi:hypothetical protein
MHSQRNENVAEVYSFMKENGRNGKVIDIKEE